MKKFRFLIILLVTFLSSCSLSNHILAQKMLKKYSDDQSYVTLSGEITKINKNNDVIIKCEDLKNYINYQSELCDYHIYSTYIIELSIGDKIDFVTVPFHFYNGHKLPIVELKIDGKTLLLFEEGKENLINWVNTNFK